MHAERLIGQGVHAVGPVETHVARAQRHVQRLFVLASVEMLRKEGGEVPVGWLGVEHHGCLQEQATARRVVTEHQMHTIVGQDVAVVRVQ